MYRLRYIIQKEIGMIKRFNTATVTAAAMIMFAIFSATAVSAGIFGTVTTWLTGEALALFVSGIAALLFGAFGVMFKKIVRTFKETGEFLTVLGEALDDHRLNREELAEIIREGREIFEIW